MQANNLMEQIITFHTHSGAIKFKKHCGKMQIRCELMPVPRKLSSSCGVCARIISDADMTQREIDDADKLYECLKDDYKLLRTYE